MMDLIGFGDCWENELGPMLLLAYVADEIVLVRTLRDEGDTAASLRRSPVGPFEGAVRIRYAVAAGLILRR